MNLNKAEQLANELMQQHKQIKVRGITYRMTGNWTFAWNRRATALGLCNHTKKQIQLSKPLTAQRDEEGVRSTILHEIAHALAGPSNGHNHLWRNIAQEIGLVKPTAKTRDDNIKQNFKWLLVTGNEVVGGWHRKPKYPGSHYYPTARPDLKGKCRIISAQEF